MTALRSAIEQTVGKIGVVAIAATLLAFPAASTGAQTVQTAEGITTQILTSAAAVESGGQLVVMRIVVNPGTKIPAHHHPGSASFTVVSGVLQTTLVHGAAVVNRNGIEQVVDIGDLMNLAAGQSISYSPAAVKIVANPTSKPLVIMASLLLDPNESMVDYESPFPMAQPDV